ncbi:patatin-like phospholipase family protein [Pseudochelatococcus sp. B33]
MSYALSDFSSGSAIGAPFASTTTTTTPASPAPATGQGAAIDALRRRLPPPMLVPRREGGINLIRKAPEIDTLVLPGGGAKGVAYVGLMRVMKQDGAFAGVRHLVGSSAGSLAATVLAFSDDDKGMQSMLASELPTLLDTREDLRKTYPGLSFHNTMPAGARAIWRLTGGKPLGEANGLVRKLDEITSTAAKAHLDRLMDDKSADIKSADIGLASRIGTYAAAHGLDVGTVKQRLDTLRQDPAFDGDRTGRMITFRDAELLHHLAPDRFRTVEVTAYAPETGEIHYFNAETTPDVPLAYATRASISHPLLATGVRLGEGQPILIDGGLRSNIPSEAACGHDMDRAIDEPRSRDDEERRARTMVLQFDNRRPAGFAPKPKRNVVIRFFSAIGSFFSSIPGRFMSWFLNLVSLNPNADADRAKDQGKVDAAGSNGLALRHGKLRTIALNVPAEIQEEAINGASEGLSEQLAIRKDQAWFVTIDSVQDAYAMLTEEEKARILAEGPPAPPDTSARDAALQAHETAGFNVLQAKAGVDESVLADAERDLEDAERRMIKTHNDDQHAQASHALAAALYDWAFAEQRAGASSSTAA